MFICKYSIYIYKYVIYIYIYIESPPSRLHFSYADAAPKAGPGGSAVWAQADWQPNALSTTELWGNQLQRIMFGKIGKACGSKTGKGCRTPCGQTPRRPRYPKLLLLKPACRQRITPLPFAITPVRPDYAPQTRMYIRDYVTFSALAVYYNIFQSARAGCTATSARHTPPKMHAKQLPDKSVVNAARCQSAKG